MSTGSKKDFVALLQANQIEFEVKSLDVDDFVASQQASSKKIKRGMSVHMDWKRFHELETIDKFVSNVAIDHKTIASVISIGKSHEGRPLRVVKIGVAGKNKPAIWMDAGIHAREWAGPSTACFIIDQLLNHKKENLALLKAIDFYIIPVLNPDGYVYSRTVDRMWRKNRRKTEGQRRNRKGQPCYGVDLNRNWSVDFGGVGTSRNPCSDCYRGPKPFSEPETLAVKNFVENQKANWKMYLSLHSYGQVILTPWGSKLELPKDYKEMESLGKEAARALEAVHGSKFKVGTGAALMGPAAGGSDDWAKDSKIFKYSYTMELRDTDEYRFLLPEQQIQEMCEETWAAFKVFANAVTPSKKG